MLSSFVHKIKRQSMAMTMLLFSNLLGFSAFAAEANSEDTYSEAIYPKVNNQTGTNAEKIKRGEYLTKAGDCIACHTKPGGKPFAGGLPIKTPFGTMYTPNITPDQETGIGNWTSDQFDIAMREGISPQGEYYFPAFPFPYFNKLTRQDVDDIYAYLMAIPSVHEPNIPLDMPFPFRVRLLQSFWRFMFFDFNKGEFIPDARKSEEENRGAYLVQGLGHCAMCHSPLNPLGAVKHRYELAGGFIDNYHAPNISASRLKDVPTETVLKVFLQDTLLSGGRVKGPMLQVNHDSLRYMTRQDLTDIVTYLKTVDSEIPPPPKTGSGEKAGKAIYQNYCAGCHAAGGAGAPKFGESKAWTPVVKQGMDTVYKNAIQGIREMPAKGNCQTCTDEQIKLAVDYIIKRSGVTPGEDSGLTNNASMTPVDLTSLARGRDVYQQVCSVCHDKGQLGAPKLGDQSAWKPLMQENIDSLTYHAIHGYKGHPPKGACYHCTDADIIAAVKYMAQESGTGDYKLW